MANLMALLNRLVLGRALAQAGANDQPRIPEVTDEQLRAFTYDATVKVYVRDLSGRSVLDLGCGTGDSSRFLWELNAGTVVGVDISKSNIKRARAMDKNAKYIVGDAISGNFSRFGPFDVVTGIMLTSCVPNVEVLGKLVKNVRNHLQVGGELFALVPRIKSLQEPGTYSQPCQESDGVFSRDTYNRLLAENRFNRVRWLPGIVSIDGLQAKGTKYWASYMANPTYQMIHARACPARSD